MAKVIPFHGICYHPDKIKDLSDVVAPPYDVISSEEQQILHDRHPNNVVHLILGNTTEADTADNNPHTRAANFFNTWISEEILIQDSSPAMYLTSMEFPLGERTITRHGIIALVELEPFEKGIVLPHEKTFSKVKAERLELFKICKTNFSPIFSLYSDGDKILNSLTEAATDKAPDTDIINDKGHRHKMWRITDTSVQQHVSRTMEDKRIYIADGHHRYETSLNYRNWLSENSPDFNADHPSNFVMMYLCSMEDPGLVIRPAHRMLTEVADSSIDSFFDKAEECFNIETIPFNDIGPEKALEQLMLKLEMKTSNNSVGVYLKNMKEFAILTLNSGIMQRMFGKELPASLIELDVTVLTRLIFMEILNFDQTMLDNEQLITYSSYEKDAIATVLDGRCDAAFILNPTKIEQVQNVAERGEVMPRKATYFFPKVITGQVMNKLY